MENIKGITEHMRKKIIAAGGDPLRETLNIVPKVEGKTFYICEDGNYWRFYIYIEGAKAYELPENGQQFYSVTIYDALLLNQELIKTEWFHGDCLADYYKVEAFSEEHWRILENFIATESRSRVL